MDFIIHKVSFCTVCMNRLHHLKETLVKNIEDNKDYEDLEFVILDYNSKDGLRKWIQQDILPFIRSGKVVYYRTEEPSFFHRSHSRNMAFRLAKGDILCNVDADNYTGKGFASYINQRFQRKKKIVLTAIDFHRKKKRYHPSSDTFGRICFRKEDFFAIKGYDENMVTHGFQDYDFVNRLELAGVRRLFINEMRFLTAISHSDEERLSNESDNYEIKYIFVRHLNHIKSQLLFLYRKGNFETGIIVDNKAEISQYYKIALMEDIIRYNYSLENEKWIKGTWELIDDFLFLKEYGKSVQKKFRVIPDQSNGKKTIELVSKENDLLFKEISNRQIINKTLLLNRQIVNRYRMLKNYKKKNIVTNKNGFGKGEICKNFNQTEKIYLK